MSIHSTSSGDRQSGAYADGSEYHGYQPPESDSTSFYSVNSGHSGASDPAAQQQAYGYAPQQYGPPAHPALPNPGEYNPLYAAASNVLGVGLPPPNGAPPQGPVGYAPQPPPNQGYAGHPGESVVSLSSSHSMPSMDSTGTIPYGQGVPPAGYAPSIMPSNASTLSPVEDAEFEPRPSMNRMGTATSVALATRKIKAVDLRAPPYTKEYIDGYRQRIKADPDPEAHFAYAKYLIDAAKKIGADAKDQRAVRKYRDTLVQESLKVMRRLATQGQPYDEAQFFLANCHGTGMLGLQVDHEKAYHLYLQAAKQNHPAATYRVAVCNEIGAGTRKEPPRAAAFYRKAASLGDTAAMYKLGMILLHGTLGEAKNPRECVGWLRRAAEQADEDNPHALHELALLHEMPNNQYVPYDPYRARELLTRAAQLGYTQSQYKLAQCYEYGTLGCPVDPRRSIGWYTKAAEKGNSEAELALSGWYLTGSEGVLVQSDSEAYLWARRAANKGLSKAEYAVGYYAEVGIGIKQDIEFAKRWYMRAAAQGNKRAMNRLTEMKRQGNKRANVARPTRQQAKDECVIS
ncbi:HCP-like protein [Stereum hirsutum FP-91666 SS1]|uniref:HCP-like protein n=1 Tax=Stereum hirsutum (strain FP-91666) TaxID=721885 RepID=UPI000440C56A|nr:HCP-like protein [Stereum hirsutum FP-91666 SS1]EIM90536.1 HCP-like protein [Stereum hirsutum FP-91666 SS1]